MSWVGGKKALCHLIILLFPLNFDRYIEVFGGGGWVLFKKFSNNDFEVFNDLNSDLINLYRCVKERTLEFLNELRFLPLNGREEFLTLTKFLKTEEFTDDYMREELDLVQHYFSDLEAAELNELITGRAMNYDVRRAVAYYKLIRYSYASSCTSYSCQPYDMRKTFYLIWQAYRRLADVILENKDFEALVRHYDRTTSFFYCDPPYFETEGQYAVVFSKEDHVRLRDTLFNIEGKFLLSYNDCEYIRELYKGCNIMAVSRLNNIAQRHNAGSQFPEVLIANYDLNERRNNQPMQLSMSDYDFLI